MPETKKEQKIEVISGTSGPRGPQADKSYQVIRLDGVEEKDHPRPPFFQSAWFVPVVEEQVVQQK